jgi:hypothetical protein
MSRVCWSFEPVWLGGATTGRGAHQRAQRPVPLYPGSAELGVDLRRQIAEPAVWPRGVVILSPDGEHRSGVGRRCEERFIKAFVPEAPDEALCKGVLGRLAQRDIVPADLVVLRPLEDRCAGELGIVVGNAQGGSAARAMTASSSRATRTPESEVSATRQRHSRVKSSTAARILNRRTSLSVSEAKYLRALSSPGGRRAGRGPHLSNQVGPSAFRPCKQPG